MDLTDDMRKIATDQPIHRALEIWPTLDNTPWNLNAMSRDLFQTGLSLRLG
jgi:hypothetical protein